jgi:hypothetical protein
MASLPWIGHPRSDKELVELDGNQPVAVPQAGDQVSDVKEFDDQNKNQNHAKNP